MQWFLMGGNGWIAAIAEPEEDGTKYFFHEEIKEGELFFGKIPFDVLKQFAPGMVEIDPENFTVKPVPID